MGLASLYLLFSAAIFAENVYATETIQKRKSVEECAVLLAESKFTPGTRNYRSLRSVTDSPAVKAEVRELIENREFQLAVWILKKQGAGVEALALRKYLEETLRESSILSIRSVGKGVSNPQKIILQGNIAAVFKPHVSHWPQPARKYAWAAQPNSEVLAYEFSLILGLDFVPATVERTIGNIRGTIQAWVNADRSTTDPERRVAMRMFDYLINNKDRHPGNHSSARDNVFVFDHGASFVAVDATGNNGPFPELFMNPRKKLPEYFYLNLKNKLTEAVIDLMTAEKLDPVVVELIKQRRLELLVLNENPN